MIIKKIKREEIEGLDNKKKIIIKEGNSVQNYRIIDNHSYINKHNKEIFINERCLVDNKGYYYRTSKLQFYPELEYFVKYEEGLSKTKIMKYFNFAIVNDTRYIVMLINNNGLSSINIIVNDGEESLQRQLKYWISEDNNNIILEIHLIDTIHSLALIPSLKKYN